MSAEDCADAFSTLEDSSGETDATGKSTSSRNPPLQSSDHTTVAISIDDHGNDITVSNDSCNVPDELNIVTDKPTNHGSCSDDNSSYGTTSSSYSLNGNNVNSCGAKDSKDSSCSSNRCNEDGDNQPEWMKKKASLKKVVTPPQRNNLIVEGGMGDENSNDTPKVAATSPLTARRDSSAERQEPVPEWANRKLRPVKATKPAMAKAQDDSSAVEESVTFRARQKRFEAWTKNENRRSFTTDDIDALKNLKNEAENVVDGDDTKLNNNHRQPAAEPNKKRPKPAPKPLRPLLGHNGKTSAPTTPSNLQATKKLTRSWNALTKDSIHPVSNETVSSALTNSSRSQTRTDNTAASNELHAAFSKMQKKLIERRDSGDSMLFGDHSEQDGTLTRDRSGSSKGQGQGQGQTTVVGSTNTGTLKSHGSSDGAASMSYASDSDTDSEFDSFSSCSDTEGSSGQNISAAQQLIHDLDSDDTPRSKLYKKVYELLTTERAYVNRLNLIQKFCKRITDENKKNRMFPDDTIIHMFSNTESICTFHQQHLLPALESRMKEWDTNPRLGDILSRLAPFLKIYSQYVQNYDSASKLIVATYQKCAKFKSIIDELQKLKECNNLALQHHMLEPIQRVPRYELLVKDYLKLLPEDSDDKEPTERALKLVVTAASHNNEMLKTMERFQELLQIHDQLGGVLPDIVNPTRQLIKQGRLTKVSRKKGTLLERYVFLFNDLILVCSEVALSTSYRLHDKLSVEGMKTYNGDNPDLPNTFHVKTKEKVMEFYINDLEESDEWQAALWRVANDYMKKMKSFNKNVNLYETGTDEDMLGKAAPKWIRDDDASMCMVCCTLFTKLRRRHHCRACGILVCGKCSDNKHYLEYDKHVHRVCSRCYDVLVAKSGLSRDNSITDSSSVTDEPMSPPSGQNANKKKKQKLLESKATDPAVIAGFLNMSQDLRSWQKSWFAIHYDFVLYSFRGRQDIQAATSLALPGLQIRAHDDVSEVPHMFSLSHAARGTWYFDAGDDANLQKWCRALEKIVKAELPEEEPATPSQTNDTKH